MTRALSLRAGQRFFARLRRAVARTFERFTDANNHYRPEKYYMRGPGPKAKRAAAPKRE
jgi:hypothetical protein